MVMLIKPLLLSMLMSAGLNCQYGAAQMEKVSPELQESFAADPSAKVDVVISCSGDCQSLIQRLKDAGAELGEFWPEMNVLSARMTARQAELFYHDEAVDMMELDLDARIQ